MTGISQHASGDARSFAVGKGTQNINITADKMSRPVAVVLPIAAAGDGVPEVFVGRDREVRSLLDGLVPDDNLPGTVVVTAVEGMGGVGKTALARHTAEIARRGFDHAWMVDLQGYDPARRVEPAQVFGPLLRALGLTGEEIPPNEGEQATVYHQTLARLADQGQRLLLVLDNASSSDQVRDLLPRQRAHRVIVTSRDTLTLPGASRLDLDVLTEPEALDLLEEALGDRPLANDSQQAARLVELCGRLPLAVRIVAALLADEPDLTVTDLVAQLEDATTRLDALAHGEQAVAATFDLSLRHLQTQHASAAWLLRLLVLNPGPDLSTDAAGALAGVSSGAVRPLLRMLRQAHLAQHVDGRWRLHDLIRLHITRLPANDDLAKELAAARRQLFRYYLRLTDAANDHVRALPGQPVPDLFAGREAALAWLDRERANLIATVENAAGVGEHLVAVGLANVLAEFLRWRRHFTDWVTVAEHAALAVRHIEDPTRQATTSSVLGLALHQVGRFDEAIAAQQHAIALYQEVGDRQKEGMAEDNLGTTLLAVGRFHEAITSHQHALAIFQEIGDRHREGMAWNNLGAALRHAGQLVEAINAFEQDIAICQEMIDRHGEGTTWFNLGAALGLVERFEDAIDAYQHSRALLQETGDRYGEGGALTGLGVILRAAGQPEDARECWLEAVEAFTACDAPDDAARVRVMLGEL